MTFPITLGFDWIFAVLFLALGFTLGQYQKTKLEVKIDEKEAEIERLRYENFSMYTSMLTAKQADAFFRENIMGVKKTTIDYKEQEKP